MGLRAFTFDVVKNIIIYVILRFLLEYLLEGNLPEDLFYRAFTEGLVVALLGFFLLRSQTFRNLTIELADQFRKFF